MNERQKMLMTQEKLHFQKAIRVEVIRIMEEILEELKKSEEQKELEREAYYGKLLEEHISKKEENEGTHV